MSNTYSMRTARLNGTSGSGLDQLIDAIQADNGLAGNNHAANIRTGTSAADAMNVILVEAARATGAAGDGVFTTAEVVAMNAWIRANRLTQWTAFHGDDESAEETGFHLVQNNGANTNYRGQNLVNTVIDGIYHLGFEIQNGSFLNEDGNANATVAQVAGWLTQFWTDRATTDTGLDRTVALIQADAGLGAKVSQADLAGGQDAANGLNRLIVQGIAATNAAADGRIDASDVTAINAWIRADATRLATFTAYHGDDENGVETGYHLVQNDGANTTYFGKNLVNTVLDGVYHIGFQIQGGNLLNEDGAANAALSDVASWLNYFYVDQSSTGTGLDQIVDTIKTDAGLARNTSAADINAGAEAANAMNHLIIQSIAATNAMADGWITPEDLRAMSAWVRSDAGRLADFTTLHGDDENGSETGYHLVQNDGANTTYFGKNLVNTVADGIYHFGFEIKGNSFVNEDGNANAALTDVGNWLNYFYKGSTWINGTNAAESIVGTAAADEVVGQGGNDVIDGQGGDDLLWGGAGNDTLRGDVGNDILYGEQGDDSLDGGAGADVYRVSGNGSAGFQGYDTYADSGASGNDSIQAIGTGNVDIGIKRWDATTGIESIDGTGAVGTVRLLGDNSANTLDFRTTALIGANIVIDGGSGNDTLLGSAGADVLVGGAGDDSMDGGAGADVYRASGNGSSGFQGYDTYADSGTSGNDSVQAIGTGNVDIGIKRWDATTGIESVDGTGAVGTVRLLGDNSANTLDFRTTTLIGANIVIDGGSGNDTLLGSAGADVLVGGAGDDSMDGGAGADVYRASGNGSSGFQGYDTYADSGTSGNDSVQAIGTGNVDIGIKRWDATTGIESIDGTGAAGMVRLLGDNSANTLDFRTTTLIGANIVIDGGSGNDTLLGSAGADVLVGGAGDDSMDGGAGADVYRASGNGSAGFQGYDTYADSGTSGNDSVQAIGTGNVDIGIKRWDATAGIESIDGTGAAGTVRLLGDNSANTLDFRTTTLIGTNIVIDGGSGNDTLLGSAGADVLVGGAGDDSMDGGAGADVYRASGNGSSGFQGYDTYADSGASGNDSVQAIGTGNVDIGIKRWDATAGIESIDGTGAAGMVRLLGDNSANTLDFRTTTLIGANIVIDGGSGNDTLLGSTGADVLVGGAGDDSMDGGAGADVYRASGNGSAGFQGYDTYADSGASGNDSVQAIGTGNVDIGIKRWDATAGIESIDGTGAAGMVRLLGDNSANTLDFRTTTLIGTNIVIDGGSGNDTLLGSAGADVLVGGAGDDSMDGGAGADVYRASGNGSAGFQGYDTYADSGASGNDSVQAIGTGNVDIGIKRWDATAGIESIDGTGAAGMVRLLGDNSANTLDFRTTALIGANIVIDGGSGHDTLYGSAGADVIVGASGNDSMIGGTGNDLYRVGRGTGADRVIESDSTSGNVDTLAFAAGVSAEQLWFRRIGVDLEIRIIGTSDSVTVGNWYNGSDNHIEQIRTTDSARVLLDTKVDLLVSAMASMTLPTSQTLSTSAYTALAPIFATTWGG